jgi:hypothetical protein
MTYTLLDSLNTDDCFTDCTIGCNCSAHYEAIDNMYNSIVYALKQSECCTAPRVPQNYFKPFCNEYLDALKEKSIFWGRMWIDAGRPQSAELWRIKNRCALTYKNAIRQAMYTYEHSFDDEIYVHFINKEPADFWKCWNRKFRRNHMHNKPQQINGIKDSVGIATEFTKVFGETFRDLKVDEDARAEFNQACVTAGYLTSKGHTDGIEEVTVELVEKCQHSLKLGNASGLDGISTEHLIYAHPKLIVLLKSLIVCLFIAMCLKNLVRV